MSFDFLSTHKRGTILVKGQAFRKERWGKVCQEDKWQHGLQVKVLTVRPNLDECTLKETRHM